MATRLRSVTQRDDPLDVSAISRIRPPLAVISVSLLLPAPLSGQGVAVMPDAKPGLIRAPSAEPTEFRPVPLEVAQIPGVTIKYYDVAGSTPREIIAAAKRQGFKDAEGKATPSATHWEIETNIQTATTGSDCRVSVARARLTADISLPRLVIEPLAKGEALEPKEEKLQEFVLRWQQSLAALDRKLTGYLRQIGEQLPRVERAALSSRCAGARAAAERVVADIRKQTPPDL